MRVVLHRPQGRVVLAAILWVAAFCAHGEDYMTRDDFLALAFDGAAPQLQTLWLTKDIKTEAESAVGWTPNALRLRYWQVEQRSAWVLEHIGKEKPITLGVVVDAGRIERVEVLAFRESRGWEIRYPFFTAQFAGVALGQDGYLTEPIDGITGATLSVRATEKMARLALWLSRQVPG